ncbi:MAG: SGNH/GDSL hydrolase family protein [Bryobacteraceae bacterium]|jgi:lysophospholipase L1-like esterase
MIAKTGAFTMVRRIRRGTPGPPNPDLLVAAYLPESLAGADGDAIATWPDSSGHGWDLTQATPGNRPVVVAGAINGKKAAGFGGAGFSLANASGPTVVANNFSVFMVGARSVVDSNDDRLLFGDTSGWPWLLWRDLGGGGAWPPEKLEFIGVNDAIAPHQSGYVLLGGTGGPSSRTLHLGDMDEVTSGSGGSTSWQGVRFNPSGGDYGFEGACAELLVYQALDAAARDQVRAYLNAKYNLRHGPFTRQVSFDGNSLTAGSGSTYGGNYPNQVLEAMPRDVVGYNTGIGSHTTTQMIADAPTKLDPLYNAAYTRNILVAWEIRNDTYVGGKTKEEAYANFITYCQARRAVGWKVVALTILPGGGVNPDNRAWWNAQLVANWATFADALADVGADSRLQNPSDLTYWSVDAVHLNSTGYGVVAGIVTAAVQGLL